MEGVHVFVDMREFPEMKDTFSSYGKVSSYSIFVILSKRISLRYISLVISQKSRKFFIAGCFKSISKTRPIKTYILYVYRFASIPKV